MIFHFIQLVEWNLAVELEKYEPQSIKADGFIHCCTQVQINDLANKLFCGQDDLLLIEIDTSLLKVPLVYEDLYQLNQLFPHIYGVLNIDAVTKIHRLQSIINNEVVLEPYSLK